MIGGRQSEYQLHELKIATGKFKIWYSRGVQKQKHLLGNTKEVEGVIRRLKAWDLMKGKSEFRSKI